MVGPPKVINKKVDDKLLEPYEVITISRVFVFVNTKNFTSLFLLSAILYLLLEEADFSITILPILWRNP